MVSSLLVGVILAHLGVLGQRQEPTYVPTDWETALAPCPGPLIVDIPENPPSDLAPLPPTVSLRALTLWAGSMRRAVIADGKTIVLVRSRSGMLDVDPNGTARHLAWIRNLASGQSEKLFKEGVWASDLPLDAQIALAREFGDLKGLLTDLVAGGPIRTRIEPALDILVPGSGGAADRLLPLRSDGDFRDIAQAAKSRREPPVEEPIKISESESGLSFGFGETLLVSELVARAEKEFGRKYGFDNRMAKARVFPKGRFSRPLSNPGLRKSSKVCPSQSASRSPSMSSRNKSTLYSPSSLVEKPTRPSGRFSSLWHVEGTRSRSTSCGPPTRASP